MHGLVKFVIRMPSGSKYLKPAALLMGRFVTTTSASSTPLPLRLPMSTQILILKTGDLKSGSGVLRTPAGLFDGSWKNDEMTEGRLKTAAGDVFHLKYPSWATIEYKNGDRYVGDIDRATLLPHGEGSYYYTGKRDAKLGDLETYKGTFNASEFPGKSELTVLHMQVTLWRACARAG